MDNKPLYVNGHYNPELTLLEIYALLRSQRPTMAELWDKATCAQRDGLNDEYKSAIAEINYRHSCVPVDCDDDLCPCRNTDYVRNLEISAMSLDTMATIVIAMLSHTELALARGYNANEYNRDGYYQSYSPVPHRYAKVGNYYEYAKSDIGTVFTGLITIG